jgi:muramoyltetrapeptide carboxypeptidase
MPLMIKPPALKPGDTIGIMAPSSRVERANVEKACRWLENYGFQVLVHPQTFAVHNQSAGTLREKLDAFNALWNDPSIAVIMAAGGGNRSGGLLPWLDEKRIAGSPKILIGYSDLTALLCGLNRKSGLVTFHGPALNSFTNGTQEKHLELAFRVLAGLERSLPMQSASIFRPGAAKGRLVGGNLSLVSSLMGTPWEPDFDGAILFLEDAGDQLSRYDRMLTQLRNAGVFDRAAGLVFGDMRSVDDKSRVPFDFTYEDVLTELLGSATIPVITHAPFGHALDQITLPLGATASLEARSGGTIELALTESPVAFG